MRFLCKKSAMQVLVITSEQLKSELLSTKESQPVEVAWALNTADIPSKKFDACIDLLFEPDTTRINWLQSLPCDCIVVNSVLEKLNSLPENFIRINGWPTFLKREIVEAACLQESNKDVVAEIFSLFGKGIQWVPDITGFLTPRVVASIINEAFYALDENVSTREEIDTAMKLGTNYPFGPFEWANKIGIEKVYALLGQLSAEDSRYKPSELLKKTATR